jgi:hypothetical protein
MQKPKTKRTRRLQVCRKLGPALVKQIQTWLGNPVLRGRALGIVMGLGLALLVNPGLVLAQAPKPGGGGGNDITGALQKLTMAFVDFLIGVSALVLAIGIATGFLTGMVESMVGRPGGLASTWLRLAGVVVCFIGAILTISIANSIISNLSGLSGGTIILPK